VTAPDAGRVDRGSRVYVAGHRGLAGSAIWRALADEGFSDIVGVASSELDLRDRAATFSYLAQTRPDVVVLAAARVGGIAANDAFRPTSSRTTCGSRSTFWTRP
jgi:GDP-L-fucose synthase